MISDEKLKERRNETREFWQPCYENEILTDEDCGEIFNNLVAFAKLLIRGNEYINKSKNEI